MSTSDKTDAANRHHGGPGSSHQRPDRPDPTAHAGPNPGSATNDSRSHVSGGGGARAGSAMERGQRLLPPGVPSRPGTLGYFVTV
jgi:hypothetical protein